MKTAETQFSQILKCITDVYKEIYGLKDSDSDSDGWRGSSDEDPQADLPPVLLSKLSDSYQCLPAQD